MLYNRGYKSIDYKIFIMKNWLHYRSYEIKIAKKRAKLDIKKYFFASRTFDMWNVLSNDIVGSKNRHLFTKKLRNIDFTKLLKGVQLYE